VANLASLPQRNVECFSLLGGPLHKMGRRFGLVRGTNTVRLGLVLGVGLWLMVVILDLLGGRTDQLFALSVGRRTRAAAARHPLVLHVRNLGGPADDGVHWSDRQRGARAARCTRGAECRGDSRQSAGERLVARSGLAVCRHTAGGRRSSLGMYGTTGVYDPSRTRETLSTFMYFRVGVTLFRFLVFRWTWKLVLWYWFIWRVSRLDLRLIPGHPDRDGGLGGSKPSTSDSLSSSPRIRSSTARRWRVHCGRHARCRRDHLFWVAMVLL